MFLYLDGFDEAAREKAAQEIRQRVRSENEATVEESVAVEREILKDRDRKNAAVRRALETDRQAILDAWNQERDASSERYRRQREANDAALEAARREWRAAVEAAKKAGAHDFIVKLREGYATSVGERGNRLSVGQRQLICFARMLLKDPPILILDEATANVDTRTESIIQKALAGILDGRTCIIIAHRLSTITFADRIVVLDEGEIVESGNHQELLEQRGYYFDMYRMHAGDGAAL